MKTFHIFRHGETDWNAEERFQGHLDIPLNDWGREQARALVAKLAPFRLEAIVSSDLSRALETARIAAEGLGGIPVLIDPRLREAHLGGAQGLTKDEIEAKFGKDLVHRWRSWQVTDADVCYPGGETGHAIIERVFAAMESAASEHRYSRMGIASHGGVIRRVMSKLLPPGSEPVPIPNGVIYSLTYEAKAWNVTVSQ